MLVNKRIIISIFTFILISFLAFVLFFSYNMEVIADNSGFDEDVKVSVNQDKISESINDFRDFSIEIVESTKGQGQSYFVNYRIEREKFRYEAKEMLKPLLESNIKQTCQEAQLRWLELSKKISTEDEIESNLKLRGFKDVVAEVNPEKITVVIFIEELTTQEYFIIKNIINHVTGYSEDRIEVLTKS